MDLANNIQKNIFKGDWFATLTIKPIFYRRRARHQYIKTFMSVYAMLKIFCDRFNLIPELTEAGNVHYHATLHFRESMPYAKEKLIDLVKIHKVIGNSKINKMPIDEVKRVVDYIMKDYKKTKSLLLNNKEIEDNDEVAIIYIDNGKKKVNDLNTKLLDIDIDL